VLQQNRLRWYACFKKGREWLGEKMHYEMEDVYLIVRKLDRGRGKRLSDPKTNKANVMDRSKCRKLNMLHRN